MTSIIKYGIIFWGNSSNTGKIFTYKKKKIITIMAGTQPELRAEGYLNGLRNPMRCNSMQIFIYC